MRHNHLLRKNCCRKRVQAIGRQIFFSLFSGPSSEQACPKIKQQRNLFLSVAEISDEREGMLSVNVKRGDTSAQKSLKILKICFFELVILTIIGIIYFLVKKCACLLQAVLLSPVIRMKMWLLLIIFAH